MSRDHPAVGTKAQYAEMPPKHGQDSNSNADVLTKTHSLPDVALHFISGTFRHIKRDSKSIPFVIIYAQGGEFMRACQYFTAPSAKRSPTTSTYVH